VFVAGDGEEAIAKYRSEKPDLLLLDVHMPKMGGLEICRFVKGHAGTHFIPVILMTALSTPVSKVEALDAGADEYITIPFQPQELQARVRAMLRIKALGDELQKATEELEDAHRNLRRRVEAQLQTIERGSRLKRYLPPALVERILSGAADDPVLAAPRRRELTVLFSDIHNFTQIADQLEPEEVKQVVQAYLEEMSAAVFRQEGTLNKFMGDGIMVMFGDIDQPDHAIRALRAAMEMRERAFALQGRLHTVLPEPFAIGIGVHSGPATVGNLGSGRQMDYTAIGSNVNLAARLQNLSKNNQVIASSVVYEALGGRVEIANERREMMKGFAHPVRVAEVVRLL
jgi:adenylate cyclase